MRPTALRLKKSTQAGQCTGDALALIGDASQLKINVNISEFDIHQIQTGQSVTVFAAAFPEMLSQDRLLASTVRHSLQRQFAGFSNRNNAASIICETASSDLCRHECENQYSGCFSATTHCAVNAVHQKDQTEFVNILKSSGHIEPTPVKTGQTTLDAIVIEMGLKEGDKVVCTDQT